MPLKRRLVEARFCEKLSGLFLFLPVRISTCQ